MGKRFRMIWALVEGLGNVMMEIDHQDLSRPLPEVVLRGRMWLFREIQRFLPDGKTFTPMRLETAAAGAKSDMVPLPWNAQIEENAPLESWMRTGRIFEWGAAPTPAISIGEVLWKDAADEFAKRRPPSNIVQAGEAALKKIDEVAAQNPGVPLALVK